MQFKCKVYDAVGALPIKAHFTFVYSSKLFGLIFGQTFVFGRRFSVTFKSTMTRVNNENGKVVDVFA